MHLHFPVVPMLVNRTDPNFLLVLCAVCRYHSEKRIQLLLLERRWQGWAAVRPLRVLSQVQLLRGCLFVFLVGILLRRFQGRQWQFSEPTLSRIGGCWLL